jgi:hypothetical protein
MADAPKVFLSYSHEDEEWKDRITRSLRILERQGLAEVWDVSNVAAGTDWSEQVGSAVRNADLAILLVSPSFLSSDYVIDRELPALLDRSRKDGLIVLPILLKESLWTLVPDLARFQFLNDPQKPLANLNAIDREEVLSAITSRVADLVAAVAQREENREPRTVRSENLPTDRREYSPTDDQTFFFISHCRTDGDFAELLKFRLVREGYEAWIDIDRLSPGIDWRQGIDEGIRNAAALIAIMSPEARQSEYVTYEWAFGWGSKTKIIPVMLRETPLHPRLATLQYLDFSNRMARPWPRLIAALAEANTQSRRD